MPWQSYKSKPPLFGVAVPGDGPTPCPYMLIGERPGKQEPAAGKPFVGASGMELNRYLKLAGLSRDQVYVTNLVKTYEDEDPTEEEVLRDLPELLQELDECRPDTCILCGRFAIRHFLGDVDVEQVRGIAHTVPDFPGVTFYPTLHPAAGLYNGDTVPFIADDFVGLCDVDSRTRPTDRYPVDYCRQKGSDMLDSTLPLCIDSEGWADRPFSLQISQAPGEGRMVYADTASEFVGPYNRFWSSGGHTVLHNSLHDLGVLRRLGVSVRDGSFTDTMVLAYLLCLEPQGLKPLAYRLAGMDMLGYDEVIASARASLQQEWLAAAIAVAPSIPAPDLVLEWKDAEARWHVKQPQTVAQRLRRLCGDLEKKEAAGEALDIAARVAQWDDSAAAELREAIGEVYEPTLGDIPPAVAERYACRDADATFRIYPVLKAKIEAMGLDEVAAIDHAIIPMVDRMQEVGILTNPEHFRRMDEEELTPGMERLRDEIEGMVGVRINPSSSKQVAALLFKQLKLKSRKLTKGGDDSTQDKVLEAMRREHPVLPLIMDYRELDKMRGSFCRKMLKLAGPDDRVHGNIRITRVHSGRLSMTEPNLMAIPVRSTLGRRLREGFIARPGYVIGNWDLDQIEMRVIADESGDELLCELFLDPDRDIHSETAARMFDKSVESVDPKTERYAAKRVGFGIATQITGHGLVDQMELAGASHANGSRWTEPECDALIELWFGVYPGVRRYIDRTKAEVRRNGQVRDRWGRLRYLSAVWSTIERIREEALRQGPSHKIQAGAQGLMKKCMAAIWVWIKDMEGVYPLLQIHDSIMLEVREDLLPLVNEIVLEGLQETVKLSVPVTASGEWGRNWGQMKDADD